MTVPLPCCANLTSGTSALEVPFCATFCISKGCPVKERSLGPYPADSPSPKELELAVEGGVSRPLYAGISGGNASSYFLVCRLDLPRPDGFLRDGPREIKDAAGFVVCSKPVVMLDGLYI